MHLPLRRRKAEKSDCSPSHATDPDQAHDKTLEKAEPNRCAKKKTTTHGLSALKWPPATMPNYAQIDKCRPSLGLLLSLCLKCVNVRRNRLSGHVQMPSGATFLPSDSSDGNLATEA